MGFRTLTRTTNKKSTITRSIRSATNYRLFLIFLLTCSSSRRGATTAAFLVFSQSSSSSASTILVPTGSSISKIINKNKKYYTCSNNRKRWRRQEKQQQSTGTFLQDGYHNHDEIIATCNKRTGQAKQRLEKSIRREERISILEMKLEKNKKKAAKNNKNTKTTTTTGNQDDGGDDNDDDEQIQMMISESEMAELKGLLKARELFEEQYDPIIFTKEHIKFKTMHNDAFIALSRYCERYNNNQQQKQQQQAIMISRKKNNNSNIIFGGKEEQNCIITTNKESIQQQQRQPPSSLDEPINVFFLDGPDGGTTNSLLDRGGFDAKQCYVANRHKSTVESLRISGGGRLPDENVFHATAVEALSSGSGGASITSSSSSSSSVPTEDEEEESTLKRSNRRLKEGGGGALSNIDFGAYYFDGCGGYFPHIINMLSAALIRDDNDDDDYVGGGGDDDDRKKKKSMIAVGYSLVGGNKDVIEKELAISQALTIIARKRGMRMVHVLDDPSKYSIPVDIQKVGGSGGGGTFTTWLLLEPDPAITRI